MASGWRQEFLFGGYRGLGDLGGRKFPSEVQGRSPGRGFGGPGPPEAEAVCKHSLQILTAEKIKI